MHRLLIPAALALMTAAVPAMADGPSSLPRRGCDNTPTSEMTRSEIRGCEIEATLQRNWDEAVRRQEAQDYARSRAIENLKHYVPHPDERPIGCQPGARMTHQDGCQ